MSNTVLLVNQERIIETNCVFPVINKYKINKKLKKKKLREGEIGRKRGRTLSYSPLP